MNFKLEKECNEQLKEEGRMFISYYSRQLYKLEKFVEHLINVLLANLDNFSHVNYKRES